MALISAKTHKPLNLFLPHRKKAKNLLLTSNASVNEIAYDLGFEYSQYFGNLFKKKVGMSPNKFRQVN